MNFFCSTNIMRPFTKIKRYKHFAAKDRPYFLTFMTMSDKGM